MIETLLRDFRQPEYIHVLLNPLPIYGLGLSVIGLIVAVMLRSRRAQIATLIVVFLSALSAWPVFVYGEEGYDPVLSMSDEPARAWLEAHKARAEKLIYLFYAVTALSAVALGAPVKWPRSATPLASAVILLAVITFSAGGYIGYAGGKIRHREFRNGPAPTPEASP